MNGKTTKNAKIYGNSNMDLHCIKRQAHSDQESGSMEVGWLQSTRNVSKRKCASSNPMSFLCILFLYSEFAARKYQLHEGFTSPQRHMICMRCARLSLAGLRALIGQWRGWGLGSPGAIRGWKIILTTDTS